MASALGMSLLVRAVLLLIALNLAFLGLSFTSNFASQEIIAERVRQAFASGDLVDQDYLRFDTRRGWHQFDDCNILQMMINADPSRAGRAWGPLTVTSRDVDTTCGVLRELVVEGRDPATLDHFRYTRYWHGYIPVASVLLTVFDLSTMRSVLRASVYATVVLVLLAGFLKPTFRTFTTSVGVGAGLFWGLPYFGQGLSHALGDATIMVGLTSIVVWHRQLEGLGPLVMMSAAFGAVTVYFGVMSPLPVASGLLFPAAYLVSRVKPGAEGDLVRHFRHATAALGAFTLGAVGTTAGKLIVAATLVRPSGLDAFFGNLSLYTQAVAYDLPVPGFLQPIGRLVRRGVVLTYDSDAGLVALYASALLAWLAAITIARKRGTSLGWADLSAFAIGMMSVPAWVILLPHHTYVHAGFMARILIAPITLSWAALLWQLAMTGNTRQQTHTCSQRVALLTHRPAPAECDPNTLRLDRCGSSG